MTRNTVPGGPGLPRGPAAGAAGRRRAPRRRAARRGAGGRAAAPRRRPAGRAAPEGPQVPFAETSSRSERTAACEVGLVGLGRVADCTDYDAGCCKI